jgi:hypothetical protein
MAGTTNIHEAAARTRKVLDFVAGAEALFGKIVSTTDHIGRIACYEDLISSLSGERGAERYANDWDAMLGYANRATPGVTHSDPSETTKVMVIVALERQLAAERARALHPSNVFAGLQVVS